MKKLLAIFCLCLTGVAAPLAQLTIAWSSNSYLDGVTNYIVLIGPASRTYTTRVNVGIACSYNASNLVVGAPYYFAVQAQNSLGMSPYSNEIAYRSTYGQGPPAQVLGIYSTNEVITTKP